MPAGHIVKGQCVDVAASADLYFSSLSPSANILPNGSGGTDSYTGAFSKMGTSWYFMASKNGTITGSTFMSAPSFATCDTTASFYDGLVIGWAVLAVMAAAWGITVLRRGLV